MTEPIMINRNQPKRQQQQQQKPQNQLQLLVKPNKVLDISAKFSVNLLNYTTCLDKAKLEEAKWKKLRTDPVRLYGWYKTHWDFHGLE